jgi:heat shock protein HtpX
MERGARGARRDSDIGTDMSDRGPQLARYRLSNALQMALIVAALALVLAIPAWLIAGRGGVLWALVMVALTVVLAGRVPSRMVLARTGARPLARRQAPDLYRLLDALYARSRMPGDPRLFLVPSPQLNAFAVGTANDGGIAVTDGLLRHLSARQLAGVLAHETSHLRHNDTRVMSMAAAMTQLTMLGATAIQVLLLLYLPWLWAGAIEIPLAVLLVAAFSPTISTLLQLALSRNREFTADLEAVALTGDPDGLASALDVLERAQGSWLRTIFGRNPSPVSWLRTHPPTAQRIARLSELSRESGRRLSVDHYDTHPGAFRRPHDGPHLRGFGRG